MTKYPQDKYNVMVETDSHSLLGWALLNELNSADGFLS